MLLPCELPEIDQAAHTAIVLFFSEDWKPTVSSQSKKWWTIGTDYHDLLKPFVKRLAHSLLLDSDGWIAVRQYSQDTFRVTTGALRVCLARIKTHSAAITLDGRLVLRANQIGLPTRGLRPYLFDEVARLLPGTVGEDFLG